MSWRASFLGRKRVSEVREGGFMRLIDGFNGVGIETMKGSRKE